jgi:leucyl aminopeptidase
VQITAAAEDALAARADLLAVGVFKGGIEGPGTAAVLGALGLEALPITPDFRGDIGQHLLLAAPGLDVGGVLLVGLGRVDEADAERLRRAAAVAARAGRRARRLATTLAEVHPTAASVQAVAEGFLLGAHSEERYRSVPASDASRLDEVVILTPSSRLSQARDAIGRAEVYSRATIGARRLVDLPPSAKRPAQLAAAIAELVGDEVEVEVRDETALAAEGFGGILAVGAGSSHPPRLVTLRYRPTEPLGHVVLVGKGITFDSGGLSLKSPAGMMDMKADMAGAAAIAGACAVLAELGVRVEVTALLPLAENLPSGTAQRPDDVLTAFGGTTVEVADTDAEGRLVLADALALAAVDEPDAIVDLATLTGSVIAGLGRYAAGAMGNDPELLAAVQAAAELAGETVWPLPLWPELDRFLASDVADIRNIADRPHRDPGGDTIAAGLFLQRFVGDVPWLHLDIAGPAFLPRELSTDYRGPGATGFGVRTLLTWLERRA